MIDYALHPEAEREIHPQKLAWADDRARAIVNTPYGHPSWYAVAFADQTERCRELEAAGFACQSDAGEDSWSKVLMERLADLPMKDYRVPEGFNVRPLAAEIEVEAYVKLHQETFESKNMTVEWRMRTLHHPDYPPGPGTGHRRAGWPPGCFLYLLAGQMRRGTGRPGRAARLPPGFPPLRLGPSRIGGKLAEVTGTWYEENSC